MYTTLEECHEALRVAEQDVIGDMGEEALEAGYADIVEAVAWDIEDKQLLLEFCRTTLGWVPQQMRRQRQLPVAAWELESQY